MLGSGRSKQAWFAGGGLTDSARGDRLASVVFLTCFLGDAKCKVPLSKPVLQHPAAEVIMISQG